jgi:hypothetical protein
LSTAIRTDKRIIGLPITTYPPNQQPDQVHEDLHLKLEQFADDTGTAAFDERDADRMDGHIQKFCKATAAKVNQDKCVCIAIKDGTTTKYEQLKRGEKERYLGFNFNHNGVVSKVEELVTRLASQADSYQQITSTTKGKTNIWKSYLLSQLTFHLYISNIKDPIKLENIGEKLIFNRTRRLMSKLRSRKDYGNGGLELWDMKSRATAQKAWLYELFLLSRSKNENSTPYTQAWKLEVESDSPTEIHYQCWLAWKQLFTKSEFAKLDMRTVQPKFKTKQKLKSIYRLIMDVKNKNWNKYEPTPGQLIIQNATNSSILPFRLAREITVNKGRDLVWKYLLKTLPKIFEDRCKLCDGIETSQHIFFTCPTIKNQCQSIINEIMDSSNHSRVSWDEQILNKLNDGWVANTAAAIMEVVWYRRNSAKFQDRLVNISTVQIEYRLKNAKEADWDRIFKIVTRLVRKEQECTDHTQFVNNTIRIHNILEKVSKKWNNNLMKIVIPEHLVPYCSIRTNFQINL